MKAKRYILFGTIAVISCIITACGPSKVAGRVDIRKIEYHGWKDSFEITNNKVRVVVVPAIGRIMHYGYIGADNLLCHDPALYGKTLAEGKPLEQDGQPIWAAFGGDRIWPSQENMFVEINGHKRPPDHWLDGMPWDAKIVDSAVIITSKVSEYCGSQVSRKIHLLPDSTRLQIHQTMKKIKPAAKQHLEPLPLTIWNITKVRPPSVTFVSLNKDSCFDGRVFVPVWDDYDNQGRKNITVEGSNAFFTPDPARNQKMGADAPNYVAAVIGRTLIAEFFSFQPHAAYPDGGTSATIFTCPDFAELECMSPLVKLKTDESFEYDIYWELFELNSDNPDRQKLQAVNYLDKILN
ncbi:MAG: hypothetical protein JW912_01565 [Sedimentisphaerales bacterium]|nr:hypothetical protein [Sedimentisphaerales bacterium]